MAIVPFKQASGSSTPCPLFGDPLGEVFSYLPKGTHSVRLVCKLWKETYDKSIALQLEKLAKLPWLQQHPFFFTFETEIAQENAFSVFGLFNRTLREKINLPCTSSTLIIQESDLFDYKKKYNQALTIIWNKLKPRNDQTKMAHEEISAWLKAEENQEELQDIGMLNLYPASIVLPEELNQLTSLVIINLGDLPEEYSCAHFFESEISKIIQIDKYPLKDYIYSGFAYAYREPARILQALPLLKYCINEDDFNKLKSQLLDLVEAYEANETASQALVEAKSNLAKLYNEMKLPDSFDTFVSFASIAPRTKSILKSFGIDASQTQFAAAFDTFKEKTEAFKAAGEKYDAKTTLYQKTHEQIRVETGMSEVRFSW